MNPIYIRFFPRLQTYLLSRLQGLSFEDRDVNQAIELLLNMPPVDGDQFKDWLEDFSNGINNFESTKNPDLVSIHVVFSETIRLFNESAKLSLQDRNASPVYPRSKRESSFWNPFKSSSNEPPLPIVKPSQSKVKTLPAALTGFLSNFFGSLVQFRAPMAEDTFPRILFENEIIGKKCQAILDVLGITTRATEYQQPGVDSHIPKFCLELEQRHVEDLCRLAGEEIKDEPPKTPEQIAARLKPILMEMRSTEQVLAQQSARMAEFLKPPVVVKEGEKISEQERQLLQKALEQYQYIAEHPFPFFKDVNFTQTLTLSDLFVHIQNLAKQLSHPTTEIIQLFVAFKWVTAHYAELNKITAKLAAPADEYIKIGSDGEGQGVSKQTVLMTCLSPPIQRVPRYALFSGEFLKLFDDVRLATGKDMGRFIQAFNFIDWQFKTLAQSVNRADPLQSVDDMQASVISNLNASYREDATIITLIPVQPRPEVQSIDEELQQILVPLEDDWVELSPPSGHLLLPGKQPTEGEILSAKVFRPQVGSLNEMLTSSSGKADVFLIPAVVTTLFIATLVTLILLSTWYIALGVGLAGLVASVVLFDEAYDDYTRKDEKEDVSFRRSVTFLEGESTKYLKRENQQPSDDLFQQEQNSEEIVVDNGNTNHANDSTHERKL